MKGWFDFKGRGDRVDFLRTAWLVIPGLGLFGAPLTMMGMGGGQQAALLVFDTVAIGMGVVAVAVALAGACRRLHDLDLSAWWLLLGVLVPFVGLVGLVVLAMVPGQTRSNGYGPEPAIAG
ncbi:hypothetical protein DDF62_01400 [Caulobacter radicis]|uniref:DUF805 domain-containing protein n=1 Tax=Caulobacter radicis TaxID=2172650 RepID=UPI000D56E126|nr:DUF805 domain-containing protein [Caulobacter radicis]PVM93235.1 hypothetical protein DDF62_01400 [Caulobacter radicis]